ncbi:MAG: hypothetical protein RIC55_04395 [Pirellulaceae bacterium]
MCRSINLTAVMVAVTMLASLNELHGDDAELDDSLALTGKVVGVTLSSKPVFYLLENARIIELGGKTMLAGRFAPVTDSPAPVWTEGLPFAVSMDVVETLMVFESVEDYRKRTRSAVQSNYVPAQRDYQLERSNSAPKLNKDEFQPSKTPTNTPKTRSPSP